VLLKNIHAQDTDSQSKEVSCSTGLHNTYQERKEFTVKQPIALEHETRSSLFNGSMRFTARFKGRRVVKASIKWIALNRREPKVFGTA